MHQNGIARDYKDRFDDIWTRHYWISTFLRLTGDRTDRVKNS